MDFNVFPFPSTKFNFSKSESIFFDTIVFFRVELWGHLFIDLVHGMRMTAKRLILI